MPLNPSQSISLSQEFDTLPADGGSDVDASSPLMYGTPSSRVGDTPRTPGALGTPHRSRADIRGERRPTVAVGAGSEPVTGSAFCLVFSVLCPLVLRLGKGTV